MLSSWEISGGLKKGTSKPYVKAISAYFGESVDNIILSINFDCLAAIILKDKSGCPLSGFMFLSTNPFDPERAGITASILFWISL